MNLLDYITTQQYNTLEFQLEKAKLIQSIDNLKLEELKELTKSLVEMYMVKDKAVSIALSHEIRHGDIRVDEVLENRQRVKEQQLTRRTEIKNLNNLFHQ